MDLRWYGGDINRFRALAQELVGSQPDIIVTDSTPATAALQGETRTIPIVFVSVADPVASGIVPRLDRPGGNVTGFASYEAPIGGKWLELLSEIAPGLKRAAIIFNPDTFPVSTRVSNRAPSARVLTQPGSKRAADLVTSGGGTCPDSGRGRCLPLAHECWGRVAGSSAPMRGRTDGSKGVGGPALA